MTEPQYEEWRPPPTVENERALALIKPGAGRHEECRRDFEERVAEIQLMFANADAIRPPNKATRKATERLADALHRIEVVLKNENLPIDVKLLFPLDQIRKWRERCDDPSKSRTAKKSKPWLNELRAEKKRQAVMCAYVLIRKYGKLGAAEDANRGSNFCKLAALICDYPNAATNTDLSNQCRAVLRERKKRVEE